MSPNMSYNFGQNFDFSPSNIFNNNNLMKSNPPSDPLNDALIHNNHINDDEDSINEQFQDDKDPLSRKYFRYHSNKKGKDEGVNDKIKSSGVGDSVSKNCIVF